MPPEPLVLAFDTSVAHCAAALLCGDSVLARCREEMARGQAERLFPLLQVLLSNADAEWQDITRIGVGIGPGNFTGVRISVSAARGLAVSLGIPAVGVSTFEALALGLPRPVAACVDGHAGRIYVQTINKNDVLPPRITTDDTFGAAILSGATSVVGHNADVISDLSGATLRMPRYPLAVAIAMIAGKADTKSVGRPAPLYLRKPDAAAPRETAPVIFS